jgi:hypothetical protein
MKIKLHAICRDFRQTEGNLEAGAVFFEPEQKGTLHTVARKMIYGHVGTLYAVAWKIFFNHDLYR